MHIENTVDQDKVKKEFDGLIRIYKELGVQMLEIPQEKGLPDMVYAANFGNPIGNMFIKANFKYSQRKKESDFAKAFFETLHFTIKELPDDIAFEGQGDLLTIGGRWFYGYGKRSDKKAKPLLEEIIGSEIVDFRLINPYYYHLDTCFLPLDAKTVAINPRSFEEEGLEKVAHYFPNVITVSEEDNSLIACNAVVVEKTIVIARGISQKLKDDFAKYGYTTRETAMDEFRKGGGSVKCLTLEFH